MINYKLEGLNKVSSDVYVLPIVAPNLESIKCMHVVDLDFVYNSQQTLECLAKEVEFQDLIPLMTLTYHCFHLPVLELVVRTLTMWHLT